MPRQSEIDKALAAIESLATDAIPVISLINPGYGAMALAANAAFKLLIEGAEAVERAHQPAAGVVGND